MPKIEQQPSRLGVSEARFALEGLECELLRTCDGSTSLRYRESAENQWTEPMHSSKGAWAETLHVYAPAISQALVHATVAKPAMFASIGLGLGYNELLTAALALHHKLSPKDVAIFSFESQSSIRIAFEKQFRLGQSHSLPPPLHSAYEEILKLICAQFFLPKSELEHFVGQLFAHNNFHLLGALAVDNLAHLPLPSQRCCCILFDAFSPESSPDLWNDTLLQKMVETLSATNCIFASYASRTSLKRILKAHGFVLRKVIGFAGKRECTLAFRTIAT